MSVQVNNPGMAVAVGGAAVLSRVLLKADGTVCGADANQDWVGVTQEARPAGPNQQVPVRFLAAGTCIMTAAVAINKGDLVYKAANGQVGKTNTNALVGLALEAASGAGVEIAIKPLAL